MSQPRYDKTTPDTERGLTASLWRQMEIEYISMDPRLGYRLVEDFDRSFTDAISGTTSGTDSDGFTGIDAGTAGGTYTVAIDTTAPDGWVDIGSDGTTNDYGVEFGFTAQTIGLPSSTNNARGPVVAECRLSNTDADHYGFALTDAGATTALTAGSDTFADVGYIMIWVSESGAVNLSTKSAAAGTTDTKQLIAAADFTKTGTHRFAIRVNKDADNEVEVAVDGTWYSGSFCGISAASLPTGDLAPRWFATAGDGTTAPDIRVDRLDVYVKSVQSNS